MRCRYLHIPALSIVADGRPLHAFVDIQTVETADSQPVAGGTRAEETAGRVLTLGVTAARVWRLEALVQVCGAKAHNNVSNTNTVRAPRPPARG